MEPVGFFFVTKQQHIAQNKKHKTKQEEDEVVGDSETFEVDESDEYVLSVDQRMAKLVNNPKLRFVCNRLIVVWFV